MYSVIYLLRFQKLHERIIYKVWDFKINDIKICIVNLYSFIHPYL